MTVLVQAYWKGTDRDLDGSYFRAANDHNTRHEHVGEVLSPSDCEESWHDPECERLKRRSRTSIGRFVLERLLGEGRYAQVYAAFDSKLERRVALKVLDTSRCEWTINGRFVREAKITARLNHPNIVTVYEYGHDGRQQWIAYEMVNGRSLAQLATEGPPNRELSVRIVRDLALAIGHAADLGITHRDIKPSNIVVTDDGRPYLIDFGVARQQEPTSEITEEGTIIGTRLYMAPEQAIGLSHLADVRSDIYSLGIVLFELLYKRSPFAKVQVELNQRNFLDRICSKAMQIDPCNRYQSAEAFARDLTTWISFDQKKTVLIMLRNLVYKFAILRASDRAIQPPVQAVSRNRTEN